MGTIDLLVVRLKQFSSRNSGAFFDMKPEEWRRICGHGGGLLGDFPFASSRSSLEAPKGPIKPKVALALLPSADAGISKAGIGAPAQKMMGRSAALHPSFIFAA
jgi:hypothetical protein